MKKVLFSITLLALALFAFYRLSAGKNPLVNALIPEFPNFPKPIQKLSEQQSGNIYFASSTPLDLEVLLNDPNAGIPTTGVGTLFLPDNASATTPVPAMIILHGSGGISPGREMEYARLLSTNGYAALVINYYASRGVNEDTPYLMRIMTITEFDALVDAYAALKLLATHPSINTDRIGVMGFSYGAIAARFAMDERFRQKLAPELPGFAAFVDYYGPCFQDIGTQDINGNPLLTFRGTNDASNDLLACEKQENQLRLLGANVETQIYEEAAHGWELQSPKKLQRVAPYIRDCQINYTAEGRILVEGYDIVNAPLESTRENRISSRIGNGVTLQQCIKFGYIIGNDPSVKEKSDARLLAFLEEELK